jgi:Ni,Fe-hydrogenase III small subunit
VTVAAAYSKRKRQDTQVLHPVVANCLRDWLETKGTLGPESLLFPVSAKIPGAPERRTSKMMKADLAAARKKWIKESPNDQVRKQREESDFLCYHHENGLYADIHSNWHTFITNLERAGVSPRTAQSLARHSDIRLTMGVYTHVGLSDQASAIESLPAPPTFEPKQVEAEVLPATGTDGRNRRIKANLVNKPTPRTSLGRKKGAHYGAE